MSWFFPRADVSPVRAQVSSEQERRDVEQRLENTVEQARRKHLVDEKLAVHRR